MGGGRKNGRTKVTHGENFARARPVRGNKKRVMRGIKQHHGKMDRFGLTKWACRSKKHQTSSGIIKKDTEAKKNKRMAIVRKTARHDKKKDKTVVPECHVLGDDQGG